MGWQWAEAQQFSFFLLCRAAVFRAASLGACYSSTALASIVLNKLQCVIKTSNYIVFKCLNQCFSLPFLAITPHVRDRFQRNPLKPLLKPLWKKKPLKRPLVQRSLENVNNKPHNFECFDLMLAAGVNSAASPASPDPRHAPFYVHIFCANTNLRGLSSHIVYVMIFSNIWYHLHINKFAYVT